MIRVLPSLSLAEVPCAVVDVDLEQDVDDIDLRREAGPSYRAAWVLVRRDGAPIGHAVVSWDEPVLSGEELLEVLRAEFSVPVEGWGIRGTGVMGPREVVSERDVTVVICTRERPEGLRRCLLSLLAQESREFSVLVIDNAPESDRTWGVAKEFTDRLEIRYVKETSAGLSRARNRSIVESDREIIAWVDDDEEVDRRWVTQIAQGFREPTVGCVCGVMVPAELATPAQVLFEQWGGHRKGRGFRPMEFSLRELGRRAVLYPLPAFGAGGNMAMRREAILQLGGFDEALGAGTPAMGGEDTLALTELMLAGTVVRYDPTAITRHYDRTSHEGLGLQLYGYGVGLSAFFTALGLTHVNLLPDLVALGPRALSDVWSQSSVRNAGLGVTFPAELVKGNRRGIMLGPAAYLKGRAALRRRLRPHRLLRVT